MMKICFKASLVLLLSISLGMQAQTSAIADISKTIEQGDAQALSVYFDEMVTLSILDDEGQVNKENALEQIKSFFTENPPESFSHKHDGKSKEGNTFAIGEYNSEDGLMRTYFVLKGDKIQELCIELE